MADLSSCNSPTCAYTVEGNLTQCPKCGGTMRAVRESRARGWTLLVLGLFMIGMMGVITLNMATTLMNPGMEDADGSRFTGTAEQAALILYLFYALIAFGVIAAANGIYQIRTGENHKGFIIATLVVFAAIVILVATTLQQLE